MQQQNSQLRAGGCASCHLPVLPQDEDRVTSFLQQTPVHLTTVSVPAGGHGGTKYKHCRVDEALQVPFRFQESSYYAVSLATRTWGVDPCAGPLVVTELGLCQDLHAELFWVTLMWPLPTLVGAMSGCGCGCLPWAHLWFSLCIWALCTCHAGIGLH